MVVDTFSLFYLMDFGQCCRLVDFQMLLVQSPGMKRAFLLRGPRAVAAGWNWGRGFQFQNWRGVDSVTESVNRAHFEIGTPDTGVGAPWVAEMSSAIDALVTHACTGCASSRGPCELGV